MSTGVSAGRRSARRRRLLLTGVAVLVVAAIAVAGGLSLGGGHDGTASAAATSAPATRAGAVPPATGVPSTPPTPVATGTTGDVDQPPPSLPGVALDQRAAVGNGITASISSLKAIQGTGTGRGNVSGPALRVTVLLKNGTSAPVSVDGVTVALAYGRDLTPASPLNDPSAAPFHGVLGAGKQATGVYVFSIPENARDSVTVSIGYQAGAPIMVLTGSAR